MNKSEKELSCAKKKAFVWFCITILSTQPQKLDIPQNVTSQRGILWLILRANIHTHTPSRKWYLQYVTCSNVTEQLIILNHLQTNSINDSKLQKKVGG